MMKIVNATPHELRLVVEGGEVVVPPSGIMVRAAETRRQIGTIDIDGVEIPVLEMTFGEPEGLPEALADNEILVVSAITARAIAQHRPDLRDRTFTVADPVRDENGRIIGARALARI